MSWHKQIVSYGMLTLMLSNFTPITKAQGPLEGNGIVTQDQPQNNTPTPQQLPIPKVDLPTLRTGVDPSKVMRLSLADAVTMVLEHNLGIKNEQDNIKLAQFDLEGSYGVFDPVVGGSLLYSRNNIPSANPFNVGVGSNSVSFQNLNFGVNATKLFNNGATGDATFSTTRTSTNSNSSGLSPVYQPRFEMNFRQPILRNYKINQSSRNIQSLKKRLDLADVAFRQRLVDLIARVQSSYYDLAFSIKNAEIQRESVELAAVQLRNNEIQVKAGTAAPIDIVSAQAELERRKDSAISASGEKTDLNAAIGIAMDRRPELKQLQLQGELNDIDKEFFKNQLKPQVDITGTFTAQGLAGQPAASIPGFPSLNGTEFDGGIGQSLVNLFKFRSYQGGISITFPYKNRAVQASLGRTEVVTRQLDNQKRQMVLTIMTDVRNALQAVESSLQRVEAARASVKAAEEQYRGEEQKFAAGLSTTFFVLQRQNELSVARGNELRAKTDYNKARADLQRVMANNLP